MTFKLSKQLDHIGNPKLPFEMYENYVEENKHRFPESALNVMRSEKWYPYDTGLQSLEVSGFGTPQSFLKLNLLNSDDIDNQYETELTYRGLFQLNIPSIDHSNQLRWRYEEILFFSAYNSHSIKDKMFTHKIEWVGGIVWSITARELEMQCIIL
ncbi:MAG: hypothetical protein ACRBHB_02375 [Arenicella sp.]